MLAKYGDNIYTAGYHVFTTIDSRLAGPPPSRCAPGLLKYDRRHGYRGATAKVDLEDPGGGHLEYELNHFPLIGGLPARHRAKSRRKERQVLRQGVGVVTLPWEKISWARRELPDEKIDRWPTQAARSRAAATSFTPSATRRNAAIRTGPAGAKRHRRTRPEGRCHRRAHRRIRFFPKQVQPRDPGEPRSRVVSSLSLRRGLRQGIHAGERHLGRPRRDRYSRPAGGVETKGFKND